MASAKSPPVVVVDGLRAIVRGLTALTRKLAPPPIPLLEIVMGHARVHALGAIARLGIADLLANGAHDVGYLAHSTGTDEGALLRVLRALASEGILDQQGPRTFALNEISEPLRSDHPLSIRHTVIQIAAPWSVRSFLGMNETLRDGAPEFPRIFGKNVWDYFAQDAPEEGRHFHHSMREISRLDVPGLVSAYDFGQHASLIDLGGGGGQLLAGILAAAPRSRGTVYDLPSSVAEAKSTLRAAGVLERATIETGSFFDHVPSGHDAYLLRQVTHSLSDADLDRLLRRVRAAMKPGARLVVMDALVPAHGEVGAYPAYLDLLVLVVSGGRERTREDMGRAFERNGFRLREVIRTPGMTALFIGEPS